MYKYVYIYININHLEMGGITSIMGVISQNIPVCTPTWGTVLENNWSKIMTPNL